MDRPWRGAVATLLVAVTLAFPVSSARAATRLRVSIMGDSVAASIGASAPARRVLAGVDLALDAQVCRRTARAGCTWHGSTPVSVRDLALASPRQLGDVVVVVSGYNDDDRRFRADAAATVQAMAAGGVRQVVWLDLRTPSSLPAETRRRQASINATLHALDRASPVLKVVSWDAYSRGHDNWFFDPIHLRAAGAVELARFIALQLRGGRAGPRTDAVASRGARCAATNGAGNRPGPLLTAAPAPPSTTVTRVRSPARLLDTRTGTADGVTRPLGTGRELAVPVAGRGAVPQSAATAIVRVTIPATCGPGRVAVAGCGRPATRDVAAVRGRWMTMTATVLLGTFGRVCVRSSIQADVVVELLGWGVGPGR